MSWNRVATSRRRAVKAVLGLLAASLLLTACGEADPGVIGPAGVNGGLSPEGQRQEYMEGVSRSLMLLGQATQGESFAKAVNGGKKKQLQESSLAWRQGAQQLKSINPPKDAVEGHKALIAAVDKLDRWNQRIVKAAPNKTRTKKLARQASNSPASQQFEAAVCQLVDSGYEVIDPGACTPLANAEGPVG